MQVLSWDELDAVSGGQCTMDCIIVRPPMNEPIGGLIGGGRPSPDWDSLPPENL